MSNSIHIIERPTGPKGLPLIGVGLALSPQWLVQTRQEYGDAFRLNLPIGGGKGIFFAHPDAVHSILVNDQAFRKIRFRDKPKSSLNRLLGNGLFGSIGEEWRQQRKLMQPIFHRQRVVGFYDMMVSRIESNLQNLENGQVIDLHDWMNRITMDVIANAMLSSALSEDERAPFNKAIRNAITSIRANFDPPPILRRRFNQSVTLVDDLIYRVIRERQAMSSDDRPHDLLTMLLESQDEETGHQMDTRQLRDEVFTLFLAGYETTASATTWALYTLAQRPDVLERLETELATLGGRNPKAEDFGQYPYSRQIIDETLRLYPVGWFLIRKVLQDIELGGVMVRQGGTVFISPFVTHRHPDFWEDPILFSPDRFAPDASHNSRAYFPFGSGKRVCIGNHFAMLEAQLVLMLLAQRYRLELLNVKPVEFRTGFVLSPKEKILMRITKIP